MNLNIVCLSLNFFYGFLALLKTQPESQMIKLCRRVKSMAKQVQKVEVFFFQIQILTIYRIIHVLLCLHACILVKYSKQDR